MAKRGNGEGTIYYSEKLNKWVGQFSAGRKPDGSLNRKSVYGNTRKEVKEKIVTKLSEYQKGIVINKSDIKVYKLGLELIEKKYKTNKIKETSYGTISHSLNKIKDTELGNTPIQKVTYKTIQNFLNTITNLSNSYIEKIVIQLNSIFDEAINRDYIYKSPMRNVVIPISKQETKKVDAFSIEEQKELIKRFENSKYGDMFSIAMFSGMRIGEVLALSKDCVDLKNNTLKVYRTITRDTNDKVILGEHTKTYNKKTGIDAGKRTFPMSLKVSKIIKKYLKVRMDNIHNLLFWDYKKNTFITDGEINSYLKRLNVKHKIVDNIHTHVLRHTFITRCQENGMPIVVIQALVGHVEGSTITNDIYTSVSVDFMKQELGKMAQMK